MKLGFRFLTLSLCVTAGLCAVAPSLASAQELTISELLRLNTHERVFDRFTAKADELRGLLAQATDAKSAEKVRSKAEFCYVELEMLAVRLYMLPPPTPAQMEQLQKHRERFLAARTSLNAEMERLAGSPRLARHLQSVLQPLHAQQKLASSQQNDVLVAQLQTLRNQVDLYKRQHRDRAPDFRSQGWGQLTGKTDVAGLVTEHGSYGPYLPGPPRNPLLGQTRLLVVRSKPRADFVYERGDCGFVYDESSGTIWALDAEGRIFDESSVARAASE